MQTRNRGDYTIAGCELVAEGADLRVQVLSLAAGQCVPWHYHSEISDSFVCLEGPMVVETRAPRDVYRLRPGELCAVPPKTALTCTARLMARASASSCRALAYTTSCRSAGELVAAPAPPGCARSPITSGTDRASTSRPDPPCGRLLRISRA
jgi:hypothetical protein